MAHEEDQATMQAFIRSQMYSIMHPIGEHVREVQAQVQQLAKRLTATDGKIDETKVCYDQQHDEINSLVRKLAQTDSNVEKLQNDLGLTNRDKDKLGTDHEATKTDLSKVATSLRSTNTLLKQLQQKCEDLDGDVKSLHSGATKMGMSIAEEAEKAARTKELADGLNARHADMMKDINDLARSTAESHQGLERLTHHTEKKHGVLSSEQARQQEHSDSIDGRLGTAQIDIKTILEAIRNIEEKFRLMKPDSSEYGDRTDASPNSHNGGFEAATAMKAHADAMEGLKAGLNRLQDVFNAHKEDHSGLLKDLERRVGDNTTRLEGLQVAKESMTEHLRKNDGFLSKLQQTLDALGGQVDMLQLDFKGMNAAQTDTAGKVEVQRIALTKVQADLKNTDGHVDTANENLLHLKDGLAAMDVTISKLGARYDSCTRSLAGVSRGLADVGKHVYSGDHGMLAPKPTSNDAPKPLSHQGDFGFMNPRSPDLARSFPPSDYVPLPPPTMSPTMSAQARRSHCLHLRTGESTERTPLPSAR